MWVGGPVQRTAPADGLYLTCDDSSWRLECGIESWFLPQDEAAGLQEALRGGTAVATVKVDASGHAALVDVTTPLTRRRSRPMPEPHLRTTSEVGAKVKVVAWGGKVGPGTWSGAAAALSSTAAPQ